MDEASESAPIARMCMKGLLKTTEGADDGGIASGSGGSTLSWVHDRLRKAMVIISIAEGCTRKNITHRDEVFDGAAQGRGINVRGVQAVELRGSAVNLAGDAANDRGNIVRGSIRRVERAYGTKPLSSQQERQGRGRKAPRTQGSQVGGDGTLEVGQERNDVGSLALLGGGDGRDGKAECESGKDGLGEVHHDYVR